MPCKLELMMQTNKVRRGRKAKPSSAKVTDMEAIKLDTDRIPDPMWIVVKEPLRATAKAHESNVGADPTADPMWIVLKGQFRGTADLPAA